MSNKTYTRLDAPIALYPSLGDAMATNPGTLAEEWHQFDSQMEAERYQYLWGCQQDGDIHSLRAHPESFVISERIELAPNAIRPKTRYKQQRVYTPDFVYIVAGVTVYEDFKGSKRQRGYARASLAHTFFIAHLLTQMPSEKFHFKVVTDIHADPRDE